MPKAASGPTIGVVGIADGWSSSRLANAVAARTGECLLIDLRHTVLDLASGSVRLGDTDLAGLDAIIVKKIGRTYRPALLDRLEVLYFLEQRGVRIFSRARSMMRLLDRLSCTVTLRAHGIPLPETIVTEDVDLAADTVRRFGRAIFKPLYTSKARGMVVIDDGPGLTERIAAYRDHGHPVLYVQRHLSLPDSDLGLVFLGGRYLGTYARAARRFTDSPHTHTRTRYWPHTPSEDTIALAHRAQALFDLDFTCVDVAETPEGPLVFEVSAFGGFRGLLEASGIDAAALYVEYVMRELQHG